MDGFVDFLGTLGILGVLGNLGILGNLGKIDNLERKKAVYLIISHASNHTLSSS